MTYLLITFKLLALIGMVMLSLEAFGMAETTLVFGVELWKVWFVVLSVTEIIRVLGDIYDCIKG